MISTFSQIKMILSASQQYFLYFSVQMNKCFHSFCLLRKALTFFCFIMFLSLHNYRCLIPQFYSVFIKDKVFMLVCSNLWLLPSQFVRNSPADVTQKETITFLIQTNNKLLNKPVSLKKQLHHVFHKWNLIDDNQIQMYFISVLFIKH